jgi:hypothetical protein
MSTQIENPAEDSETKDFGTESFAGEELVDCIRCGTLLPENLICQQCGLVHGEEKVK